MKPGAIATRLRRLVRNDLFAGLLLFALLLPLMTAGCEFENLTDQEYGPVGPGNGSSDTTDTTSNGGTDTTGNGGSDTTDTTGNGGNDTIDVSMTLAPVVVTIKAGETVQFTATVTGSPNTSVTWVMLSGPGSISAAGLYSSPSSVTTDPEVAVVRAISNADQSVSETSTVVVTAPDGGGGGGGDVAGPGEICFERDILPIFQSNCAKSGCHNVTSHQHGYTFTSYDGIMDGIRAGRPDNSEIYEKITEDRLDKRMPPPPNTPLNSQQISTIRQWIVEGARNTICPPDENSCDTTQVTYSGTLRPILDKYCIGCHSGSNPPRGINLTLYSDVRTVALDGRLVGVTQRLPGFPAMPFGGSKLPDCELQKIEAWVNRGAQQN